MFAWHEYIIFQNNVYLFKQIVKHQKFVKNEKGYQNWFVFCGETIDVLWCPPLMHEVKYG